jgi:Protein of unknown function (DUF3127).
MDYEFTGTVKKVGDVQMVGSNGFSKRELIVTSEEERYPQVVAFEFLKERAEQLDAVKENERVTVRFDISGREWTSPDGTVKYFNSLRGWKVERLDESGGGSDAQKPASRAAAGGGARPPAPAQRAAEMPRDAATADGNDDLPF